MFSMDSTALMEISTKGYIHTADTGPFWVLSRCTASLGVKQWKQWFTITTLSQIVETPFRYTQYCPHKYHITQEVKHGLGFLLSTLQKILDNYLNRIVIYTVYSLNNTN